MLDHERVRGIPPLDAINSRIRRPARRGRPLGVSVGVAA